MARIHTKLFSVWLTLTVLVQISQSQKELHLNDVCILETGGNGKCLRLKECPKALELIRQNKKPINCGFEGTDPIVCCDTKQLLIERRVGDISKQKCNETYSTFNGLPIFAAAARPVFSESKQLQNSRKRRETLMIIPNQMNVFGVVGGEDSLGKEFPHMAALGYGDKPDVKWSCGGALISEKFVLTAAHCINTRQQGNVKYVRLGDLDLNSSTDLANPQDFDVLRTIRHPGYKAPSVYNDIGLVELKGLVLYSDFIRPACLNTERAITNPNWIATGWGATSFGGESSSILQKVDLKEASHADCQQAFNSTSARRLRNGIDDASQVCAGELAKDTCQGDSGGPLQIRNLDYSRGYSLIGLTSFGIACGIGNTPAVYTRVSHYIGWIESIVWPN